MLHATTGITMIYHQFLRAHRLGLPPFGSELWSEPEPSRTGPKFSPGFRAGAEPDCRSSSGFRVGPNLAEPFRTGSEPQTEPESQHAEQAHRGCIATASHFRICKLQVSTLYHVTASCTTTASGSASHPSRLSSCLSQYTLMCTQVDSTNQLYTFHSLPSLTEKTC